MKETKVQITVGKPELDVVINKTFVHRPCPGCGLHTRQELKITKKGWEFYTCSKCNNVASYRVS